MRIDAGDGWRCSPFSVDILVNNWLPGVNQLGDLLYLCVHDIGLDLRDAQNMSVFEIADWLDRHKRWEQKRADIQ